MKVRVTQRYSAKPERVFDAWLDPNTAGTWLFATASHPMTRVSIDARAGGLFRFLDRQNGASTEYKGRYIEISPPRRLVFALFTENSAKTVARVVAEIVPRKSGCELRLVHDNVPATHASRVENRWTGMLYGLDATLRARGARDPGHIGRLRSSVKSVSA